MQFGLSYAPEIYQMAMDNLFEECPDISPYFDAMLYIVKIWKIIVES